MFIHNSKNYDNHILTQTLHTTNHRIKVIGKNLETYTAIRVGPLIFKDSYQFLGASLEVLVENLKIEGEDKFKYLIDEFGEEKAKLLMRKGEFCYDF